MKFTTGLCRLSYANIFEPREDLSHNLKYSCSLIIPKEDEKQVARIKAAFKEMLEDKEILQKVGGKVKGIDLPLWDGDDKEDENYANCYYLNAKANKDHPPKVLDKDRNEVFDSSEVYSGCYVQAVLDFFPYNQSGNKGIGVGLRGIRKIKDGAPLSGGGVSDSDFDDAFIEDDLI